MTILVKSALRVCVAPAVAKSSIRSFFGTDQTRRRLSCTSRNRESMLKGWIKVNQMAKIGTAMEMTGSPVTNHLSVPRAFLVGT
jgi:hypothetical protein